MRRWRATIALLVAFALSIPAITHRIYASDEIQYYAFLRSLWFDHDVSFDDEYRYFEAHSGAAGSGFHDTFLTDTTPTGLRPTFATVGCALLWAPFYAGGDLVAHALHAMGRPVAVDGYSSPYVAAVAFGSACYGFAALLLSGAIARRILGRPTPWAIVAVWIGTPLLFYMYVAPVFAHACEAFMVALLLWTWLRTRDRWTLGVAALLGLLGAITFMVREQEALVLAGPALDGLSLLWRGPSKMRWPRAAELGLAAAAAFVLGALPQILIYVAINGHPGPNATVSRKLTWWSPHGLQVLGSPEHGLFAWTPLALVALVGLAWLWLGPVPVGARWTADRRWIASCLVVTVGLTVYVVGAVESWTVAGAFGQRRFVALTPIFVVGLAALFDGLRRSPPIARALTGLLVILAIWWNLGLMAQFGLNTMDRQRLSLGADARRTFLDLPRQAPSLVWRYFTARETFYGRPHE